MSSQTPDDDEVEVEYHHFVRIYKSGRAERIPVPEFIPAGQDPATGVLSKDVTIDDDVGVSARLYLPQNTTTPQDNKKLPILVYYHGGGFCIETPFTPTYHPYLNSLVAKAGVVAVSVGYRLAPEHRLPAAYDDSWAALEWVASKGDSWLAEYGDFGRVYMAGDSAGANIVHHMAMRAGTHGLAEGVRIRGIALIHPYFLSSETAGAGGLWKFTCPSTTGVDDPYINPMSERAPGLAGLGCDKVLVSVAGLDFLRGAGRSYYDALKESGWRGDHVELFESEGEEHVFHLKKPASENALAKMERVVGFLNGV